MEDSKETLCHARMRPTQPILTPSGCFKALKPELDQLDRLPEVEGVSIEEWFRAIKGDVLMLLSHFDYAAPLTEMVLWGARD